MVNERIDIFMQLHNERLTAAGLRSTASSMFSLDSAVQRYGRHLESTTHRSFAMNQALFTLRRYSYMATLALTAGIGVIAHWGYEYNTQVQNAKVALGLFLPTQGAVNNEIARLYRIAAVTPFLFTDITTAARRFMAFGADLTTTNRLVTNITDALSAYGITTGAALNRASLALGHMMSLGRLSGQIVYQLARDNIPIIQALETELGLTGEQLRHVGTLGISAATAIGALNAYIEHSRFHGAGERFGLGTVQGLLSTLRDYTAQVVGRFEQHQFEALQRIASRTVHFLTGAGARGFAAGGVGGFLGAIDPNVERIYKLLAMDVSALARIFRQDLVPAVQLVVHWLGPPIAAELYLVSHLFVFLSHHGLLLWAMFTVIAAALATQIARYIIMLPLMALYRTYLLTQASILRILTILGWRKVVVDEAETIATAEKTAAERGYTIQAGWSRVMLGRLITRTWAMIIASRAYVAVTRLWMAVTKGAIVAEGGRFVSLTRLEKAVMSFRRKFIASMIAMRTQAIATFIAIDAFLGPVGWIILGITLVIAGLTLLYFKWAWFHNFVDRTYHWLRGHWPLLLGILTGPFGLAALQIYKHFEAIKAKILSIYNWVVDKIHWISRQVHRFLGWFGIGTPGAGPAIQSTSTPTSAPFTAFPSNTTPFPAFSGNTTTITGNGQNAPTINLPKVIELHSHTELKVDGKTLAKSTAKANREIKASR